MMSRSSGYLKLKLVGSLNLRYYLVSDGRKKYIMDISPFTVFSMMSFMGPSRYKLYPTEEYPDHKPITKMIYGYKILFYITSIITILITFLVYRNKLVQERFYINISIAGILLTYLTWFVVIGVIYFALWKSTKIDFSSKKFIQVKRISKNIQGDQKKEKFVKYQALILPLILLIIFSLVVINNLLLYLAYVVTFLFIYSLGPIFDIEYVCKKFSFKKV